MANISIIIQAITQLQSASSRNIRSTLTKEKDRIVERMEAKGRQISIIQEHLDKVQASQVASGRKPPRKQKTSKSSATNSSGGDTARTTPAGAERKVNEKLDIYKKVKKIQSTLCKGDLKWV